MATNGEKHTFPPVVLDTTLYDLLEQEVSDGEKVETLCKLKPHSDKAKGEATPLSNKYIIHSAQVGDGDDLAHLQLENCSHLLMFFAGRMNVVFIGSEGRSEDPTLSKDAVDENAKRSFSVIQESQRPRITTYANVEDFVENYKGPKIRWGFGMDFAENLPSLFDPELVYLLNSKRWLADCELKSANDLILDNKVQCRSHNTKAGNWYYGGTECVDCTAGMKAEMQRVRTILKEHPLPYVLKLTQSLSSVGTNIVQTEEDRAQVVDKMGEYLESFLTRITPENTHLLTTSLILSDFIKGPTMALNFHVRKDGSAVFLGACHQLSTGESGRQATAITYADQEKLEKKYQRMLDRIGQALHAEGYYGPVGADILENPDDGTQYAIDLNVRTPLSLVLYLLKGHFHDKRGFAMSMIYECVMLTIPREELEKRFAKEFEEARIVLLGSSRMGQKEQWAYGVMLAGEDKSQLDDLSERLLKFEAASDVEE